MDRKWILAGMVVVLVVTAFAFISMSIADSNRSPQERLHRRWPHVWEACHGMYARASTAHDSLVVDGTSMGPGGLGDRITCAELR